MLLSNRELVRQLRDDVYQFRVYRVHVIGVITTSIVSIVKESPPLRGI